MNTRRKKRGRLESKGLSISVSRGVLLPRDVLREAPASRPAVVGRRLCGARQLVEQAAQQPLDDEVELLFREGAAGVRVEGFAELALVSVETGADAARARADLRGALDGHLAEGGDRTRGQQQAQGAPQERAQQDGDRHAAG